MYEHSWFRGQSGTRLPPSIALRSCVLRWALHEISKKGNFSTKKKRALASLDIAVSFPLWSIYDIWRRRQDYVTAGQGAQCSKLSSWTTHLRQLSLLWASSWAFWFLAVHTSILLLSSTSNNLTGHSTSITIIGFELATCSSVANHTAVLSQALSAYGLWQTQLLERAVHLK